VELCVIIIIKYIYIIVKYYYKKITKTKYCYFAQKKGDEYLIGNAYGVILSFWLAVEIQKKIKNYEAKLPFKSFAHQGYIYLI